MHNDEVVWQALGNNFCSYRAKITDNNFCRNKYNVTGLCNRVSCPLANGYYATVMEHEGNCYLCLKSVERVHMPSKMFEWIKLPVNFNEALGEIESRMKHSYKGHQINRCKLRFVRLRQTLTRMRRQLLDPQARLVAVKKKTERREATREQKALVAARLETAIEKELLARLQQGVYGTLYSTGMTSTNEATPSSWLLQQEVNSEPVDSSRGHAIAIGVDKVPASISGDSSTVTPEDEDPDKQDEELRQLLIELRAADGNEEFDSDTEIRFKDLDLEELAVAPSDSESEIDNDPNEEVSSDSDSCASTASCPSHEDEVMQTPELQDGVNASAIDDMSSDGGSTRMSPRGTRKQRKVRKRVRFMDADKFFASEQEACASEEVAASASPPTKTTTRETNGRNLRTRYAPRVQIEYEYEDEPPIFRSATSQTSRP